MAEKSVPEQSNKSEASKAKGKIVFGVYTSSYEVWVAKDRFKDITYSTEIINKNGLFNIKHNQTNF